MKCPNCGRETGEKETECPHCGEALPKKPKEQPARQKLRLFVGKNADFYMKKWKNNWSWNWAAFFFTVFWLGYRKMYMQILVMIAVYLLTDILLINVRPGMYGNYTLAVSLAFSFFYGIQGNRLYKEFAQKRIRLIERVLEQKAMISQYIQSAGGASSRGVMIAVILMCIYSLINSLIVGQL